MRELISSLQHLILSLSSDYSVMSRLGIWNVRRPQSCVFFGIVAAENGKL